MNIGDSNLEMANILTNSDLKDQRLSFMIPLSSVGRAVADVVHSAHASFMTYTASCQALLNLALATVTLSALRLRCQHVTFNVSILQH